MSRYQAKQVVVYIGENKSDWWSRQDLEYGQQLTLIYSDCVGSWKVREKSISVLECEIRPLSPLEELL